MHRNIYKMSEKRITLHQVSNAPSRHQRLTNKNPVYGVGCFLELLANEILLTHKYYQFLTVLFVTLWNLTII